VILLTAASWVAKIIGISHRQPASVEYFWDSLASWPGWLQTSILLISASPVAQIIGMSHQLLASVDFNLTPKDLGSTKIKTQIKCCLSYINVKSWNYLHNFKNNNITHCPSFQRISL
jgi:hypothetical protein